MLVSEILDAIKEYETPFVSRNPNYHDITVDEKLIADEQSVLHYVFSHPPLYHIWGALIFSLSKGLDIINKLYLIRAFNIVFVLITFFYTSRFVQKLKISKYAKSALLVMTNFFPMYLFVTAGINNDVLLTTASIATLVISYEIFSAKKTVNYWNLLELSLWINAGLLTKAQYVPLLVFVSVALISKIREKKIGIKSFIILLAGLIPSMIYFITRLLIYRQLYPMVNLGQDSPDVVVGTAYKLTETCTDLPILNYVRALIYPRLALLAQNFVGNFGWLDTKVPLWIVTAFVILFAISILGILKYLLISLRKKDSLKAWFWFIGIPIISLETFFCYLYLKTYIPNCYLYFPVQGRYYFPILLPIMFLIVKGVEYIFPNRWHKYIYSGLFIMTLIYLTYSISLILQRYYL